jgi:hypothetical protein
MIACLVIKMTRKFTHALNNNQSLILHLMTAEIKHDETISLLVRIWIMEKSVGIIMGTNCAPLLTDLFLYSYEAEFVQKLLWDNNKN